MTQRILVISSATDATTTYVCERFESRNIPFWRFDVEKFPIFWKMQWAIHPYAPAILTGDGDILSSDQVKSVWYRRPGNPLIAPEIQEPSARDFASKECDVALSALWQDLDVLWVNHPTAIRYATRKPHQLKTAANLGFNVPDTILSTDPEQIRNFWQQHDQAVVFKTLHQDAIEIGGKNYFAYASRLTSTHFENPKIFKLSPALFQQYIKPKLELRVTVIGKTLFTAAIDTLSAQDGADWRHISPDSQKWFEYKLPPDLQRKCLDFVHGYGLQFGALDLIIDEKDTPYFLELNANGQWVWIELITAMPMSQAMIDLLDC